MVFSTLQYSPSVLSSASRCKQVILGTAVVLASSEILWPVLKKAYSKCKDLYELYKSRRRIMKVLFFSQKTSPCKIHRILKIPYCECPSERFEIVLSYLKSTKKTLDVCVYFLSNGALVNAIIELYKQDVDIRIITDDDMGEHSDCKNMPLRKLGIKIRTRPIREGERCLMHHKFAIIDKTLLMTGSANWTDQAFSNNYENVIITNQEDLVKSFASEFNRVWEILDAI